MRPSQSLLIAALLLGCGGTYDQSWPLDGDKPLQFVIENRLRAVAGANLPTVQAMANEAAATWNPAAQGAPQLVSLDYDNDTTWHCQEDAVQAWSPRPPHVVYLCPKFSLANAGKLRQVLLHELGHQLGATGHVPHNGRALGPIMCGWPGCMDPALTDYQPEDVSYICMAGRGGRCRGL